MRIQPKTSYKLHPVQTLCIFLSDPTLFRVGKGGPMKNMIVFLGLVMPSVATADLYKCISPKGKTTYSDSPCVSSNKSSTKLSIANNPKPTLRGQKPSWEIDHDRTLMNHIRSGELDAAERLAVTPNQMNMVQRAKQKMFLEGLPRNPRESQKKPVNDEPDFGSVNNDAEKNDFDTRMKAKRDYQKQQIPGAITHQPTDAHERGVYKQEMNRQKNIDPNTWYR